MPYNLRNFDGRAFTTISDGVVDQQGSSSLYLIGKEVTSYGTYQNDNFLWLMEHFAGTVEPVNKVQGQIWFDRTPGVLKPKVYDGSEWKTFNMAQIADEEPLNSQLGDFWFNTSTDQLFIKNTSTFSLIGPENVEGYGTTRLVSVEILDIDSNGHACIILYVDGSILGVISNDSFFVKDTEEIYSQGITYVGKGFTFVNGASAVSTGTFARIAVDEIITGNYTFDHEDGINIKTTRLSGTESDDFYINAGTNDVIVNAANIKPVGSGTLLGSPTERFAKVYTSEISGGTSISGVTMTGQFSLSGSSKLFPAVNGTISLGAANARWATVFTSGLNAGSDTDSGIITGKWTVGPTSSIKLSAGAVINANYADVAEKYSSDKSYEPGTVLMFGGSKEVTIASGEDTKRVAGIVTTKPAYVLNDDLKDSVTIALVGRVPCKVVGTIRKGDLLVVSSIAGVATSNNNAAAGTIVAKALEEYDSYYVGTIEVMVVRG